MSRTPNAPLQIAFVTGTLTLPLADLLARQRAEEPETYFRIIETTLEDQRQGLTDGRYNVGFSLTPGKHLDTLQAIPLWHDELVAVVPPQSPLLAFDKIPLRETLQYPLILWHWKDCEVLNQQINSLLASIEAEVKIKFHVAEQVTSFGLMAVFVAAGYGIGICAQSWINVSRKMGTVIRPLAGQPHYVTTYLTHLPQPLSEPVRRFILRAQLLTTSIQTTSLWYDEVSDQV